MKLDMRADLSGKAMVFMLCRSCKRDARSISSSKKAYFEWEM